METYLNKLTVIELRKRSKIIGRDRIKKDERIQQILEQKEDIPHYYEEA